jgi:hypothetical protein
VIPPHNVVNDGVVIEAREPSGEIQLITQGIEFSVILVREEKRADTSDTDRRRCVGPESVVENQGVGGVVEVFSDSDATSEMRGASCKGDVATVKLSQVSTEKKDGGKYCRETPTPSPPIKLNVPGTTRDSARMLRSSNDDEIGRWSGNVSTDEEP